MFWHKLVKKLIVFFIFIFIASLLAVSVLVISLEMGLPNVDKLKDVHYQEPLRIFTSDGKLMAEFGEIRRIPISLNQVPKMLIFATLATEDQRYFSHPGVDFLGLTRVGIVLALTGKKQQGGSTITMQVARNFFLTRKKTFSRKVREILLALKIDREFSKEKILELYFNQNFYGARAYGIAAAAKIYFGKTLDQLSLPEMAMLAGLPKAPTSLNPLIYPVAAKDRRDHVLERMLELHYIDQKTYEAAVDSPLSAEYHDWKVSVYAPYVAEMVRQVAVQNFGNDVYDKGLSIYTTIDSRLQEEVHTATRSGLLSYDRRHGYRGAETNFGDEPPNPIDPWLYKLKKIPTIDGLYPAIVISLDAQAATLLLKDGHTTALPFREMSWARKQILYGQNETFGAYPRQPSDVVKIGDVIRITKSKDEHSSWTLSQIPIAETAMVVLDPHDGAILALTGGFNYFKSNYNRVTQAMRQPGSAFKPFIYSAALDKGLTLATVINDAPIAIPDGNGSSLWRPENDTKKFYGPTRIREALTHSRNLVSIRLLQQIGLPYAIDYITRFGFEKSELPTGLTLALGTASITPLQLATGYAVFANGGYLVSPYFITRILDANKHLLFEAHPAVAGDPLSTDGRIQPSKTDKKMRKKTAPEQIIAPRVISPTIAYLMTSAMKDVVKKGTAKEASSLKRNDIAGKTGTTNQQVDTWFSGFNSNLVAVVWIGFDQPYPLREYAAKAALPIWIEFMGTALANQPEVSMPEPTGLVAVRIDKKTGLLAGPHSKDTMFELFLKQDIPTARTETDESEETTNAENNLNRLY